MPSFPSDLNIPDEQTVLHPAHAKFVIRLYIGIFIVGGHILLPLLLATFVFSNNVKRHPTLLNLLFSLSICSVFSCILAYAGKEIGPQPSKALCTAQAALEAGVTPMTAMATLALVFNVWTHIVFTTGIVAHRQSHFVTALLVASSHIVLLGFLGGNLYLGLSHPEDVSRDRRFFHCTVYNKSFVQSQAYISSVLFLLVVILEIHIAQTLFRNRRALRRAGYCSGLDVQHVLRILTVGIYVIAALMYLLVHVFPCYPSTKNRALLTKYIVAA